MITFTIQCSVMTTCSGIRKCISRTTPRIVLAATRFKARRASSSNKLTSHVIQMNQSKNDCTTSPEINGDAMSYCDECDGRGSYLDAPGHVLDGGTYQQECHVCCGSGEGIATLVECAFSLCSAVAVQRVRISRYDFADVCAYHANFVKGQMATSITFTAKPHSQRTDPAREDDSDSTSVERRDS